MAFTVGITDLDMGESDLLLGYLFDCFERSVDIQVVFGWTRGTSALWVNRYISLCFLKVFECSHVVLLHFLEDGRMAPISMPVAAVIGADDRNFNGHTLRVFNKHSAIERG